MIDKYKKIFKKSFSQKETVFLSFEGVFLIIFYYLTTNDNNSLKNFGNYFHNVNIALFTILIPLAIAVLSDYFRAKRNNTGIDYSELDLIVIINNVFNVKRILIIILLVYLPSFIWSESNFVTRNILLIFWLVGVKMLVTIILDFIIWIKNPYYHRFKFLKKIRENGEYISAWVSVWKAKENNKDKELMFFEIFSKNINYLIKNNRTNLFFNSLLRTFTNQIQNREKDTLLYGGKESPFEKILEWYYKAETLYKKNEQGFPFDYNIHPALEHIEIQSLDKSYNRYLQLLKIHLDKHSDDIEYVENFFVSFLSILLSNLDKISSELMFWKAYPEDWKIKATNLESQKIIPFISLREVIIWSEKKISDNIMENIGYDSKLNKVFYNLFPDTEPISWANIITFLFFPYSENKIEDLIKAKIVFGGMGRFTVSWGDSPIEAKAEVQYKKGLEENKKLLKFIYRIIPVVFFSKGNIKDYRGILLGYESEYRDDRNKLRRVREFLSILDILEEFINGMNKE